MACIHSLPATSLAKLKSALKMQEGDSAYFFNRSKKGSLLLPRIENEVHFRVKWCWVTQGDVEAETSLSLIEECSDGSASIFDFQVGRDRQLTCWTDTVDTHSAAAEGGHARRRPFHFPSLAAARRQ